MIGFRHTCTVEGVTSSLRTRDIQLADQNKKYDIYLPIYEKQAKLLE
jgi:hypothetical protein